MLYDEFLKGTGCKDNEKNYKVYKDLEILYSNSELSKSEIYEYGKKLVDNSKSEAQIKFENEMNEKIDSLKRDIESAKDWVDYYESIGNVNMRDYYKKEIKNYKRQIRDIKWIMEG